ncbi:MAG: NUDIX domain-containing protein [Bradymonadia bacterium]
MAEKEYPRPALTADVVALRLRGRLEVLLIERARAPFKGCYALPGGFVDPDETPQTAAHRELEEETGVKGLPLMEIGVFGTPGRDPRGWVVTSAWLGLAPADCEAQAGDDAAKARWFPLDALPGLAFDHDEIIEAARQRLMTQAQVGPWPLGLLGDTFRTRHVRLLYNQIFGTSVPPRSFKAWLRHRGAVIRVGPARFKAAERFTGWIKSL